MKFKSLLFLLLFLCFLNQAAVAQKQLTPQEKQKLDEAIANGAVKYSLAAAKTLLEANEVTSVQVKLTIPPKVDDQGVMTTLPQEIPMPTDNTVPYRAANWKILQGGGNLTEVDEFAQSYSAPASAPPGKTMTISVELMPILKKYPKIVLLQTLYFTQNENSFVLNMPEIGANNSKYISKANEGVKVPTMQGVDPRVAARMPPDIQAKMAAAQAQMQAAQQQSGINLSAVTSNAMALYDAPNNLTAIKFTTISLQYNNGRVAAQSTGNAFLEFSFKGKGVGTYSLNDEAAGLGFMLTMNGKGVGCGKNNGSKDAPCNGSVKITSMDDKTIKGEVMTRVYTIVGDDLSAGTFYGKFSVNRAN